MNAARAILLALLLGWIFPGLTSSRALANVAVPPLVGRVVDQTGTLSGGDVAALNQTLRNFEARKGSQIAVLIVPTTEGEAIEPFSLRVAETWKIGRKKIDDGALLVIAKNDRHLRIEVGYGLEGVLTDLTTKRIIDEDITPKFKSGDFAGGIAAGIGRMIRLIDGETLPAPEPPHWQDSNLLSHFDPFNPFILVGFVVLGSMLRALFGRLLGSAATGGVVATAAWFIAGSLGVSVLLGGIAFVIAMFADTFTSGGPPGRYGGGLSGGSSSGGWSGGGSSGGFSGGGGGFGGGGASGKW
jgi:uncharacterized protein